MSTSLTLSVISACLAALMMLTYFAAGRPRWRIRLAIFFAIVALLSAMFDVGLIKAYNMPATPIHYAPSPYAR